MSLPGDGFARSVQSLNVRLVIDTIAVLRGQLMQVKPWSLWINDPIGIGDMFCAIGAIVLPEQRGQP